MVKYFISFVLLVYVTVETIRIQAATDTKLTSKEINTLPMLELLNYLQQQQNQEQSQYHHHQRYHFEEDTTKHKQQLQQEHHKRNRTNHLQYQIQKQQQRHQHKQNELAHQQYEEQMENSNENDAAMEALHQYLHLKRHFQRQLEHEQQHEQLIHQQQQHHHHQQSQAEAITKQLPSSSSASVKSHQQHHTQEHYPLAEDRMYGDGAATTHDNSQETIELPAETNFDNYYNKEIIEAEKLRSNSLEDHFYDLNEHINQQLKTQHHHQQQQLQNSQSFNAKQRCPKCESNRRVEQISEEELTKLRIQYVKQQILEKLRLKERPNVSAVNVPKPLYEGTTIEHNDEQTKNKEFDDYYARTSTKFILLKKENQICQHLQLIPSICFSFKINDADADSFDVNNAVLWIHKKKFNPIRNNTILNQQTIVVSEVQEQQLDAKFIPILKPIAIQTVKDKNEWTTINIEWPIKRWFGNHDLSHLIQISCETCEIKSMDELISAEQDYQPFIMVDAKNRRRASRPKRAINCINGVKECCRDKLYISFDEIGWGDWIIQPRGYNAYFCRGSCSSIASVTHSLTQHNSIVQKVVNLPRANGSPPLELVPCCTANKYSSLELVFMENNSTATLKTFPNMVVESCGCR